MSKSKIYGKVIKVRADLKTVDVMTEQVHVHPLYGIRTYKKKKVAAGFEQDGFLALLTAGQRVVMKPCRRLSKTKYHMIYEVMA